MAELGELEAHHAAFTQRNVHVVVVSIEGRNEAEQTRKDFPHLTVLSDPERKLASVVDVIHYHSAPDGGDSTAPTTILIDRDGIVRWIYRPHRHIVRLSPEELLAAIDKYYRGGN
jgi:peroxiredoxin